MVMGAAPCRPPGLSAACGDVGWPETLSGCCMLVCCCAWSAPALRLQWLVVQPRVLRDRRVKYSGALPTVDGFGYSRLLLPDFEPSSKVRRRRRPGRGVWRGV